MAKINLRSILSGFLSTSALTSNFDDIEEEFQNKVLYRDNPAGQPNQMENDLDMNSKEIINLGVPSGQQSAARLADVTSVSGVTEPVPPQAGRAQTPRRGGGRGARTHAPGSDV